MSIDKTRLKQVDEATPESYVGLKEAVDKGYKKFLKKYNLEPREPFRYGRIDKDDPKQ